MRDYLKSLPDPDGLEPIIQVEKHVVLSSAALK
jgi:hypothetical protein